ncbi:MAG: hypothetical protein LBG80_15720 [Bacteroidales bacterium]|jgi:hypothetical protein|nr:hypothetical protein [Bacteroidales bacterium]
MKYSQKTSLLVTIPFILFGTGWLFSVLTFNHVNSFGTLFMYIAIASMFILLGTGWVNGFPRWSFPAIGCCLFMSCYFMGVSIPVISKSLLSVWAWLPFLITVIICSLLKPSLIPFKQLFSDIRQHPASLLLMLYGIIPFIVIAICDEIYSPQIIPAIVIITLMLAGGIYYFFRSNKNKIKTAVIVSTAVISIGIALSVCFSA